MNKTNEQKRTRDMEIRNRLTVTRGEEGWGEGRKGGKGSSQGTGTDGSWTWTTGCRFTVGVGGGQGRATGKSGTTVLEQPEKKQSRQA